MLVDAWLPRAAAARPGRLAVGRLTYSELLAAAQSAGGALRASGAGTGDRVALALAPGEDFAVALHACLLLGCVAVPIDQRLASAERERRTAGVALVVGSPLPREGEAPAFSAYAHDLDAPAIVVYTSGTGAQPREIQLTYGNWLWSALGSAAALGVDAQGGWLCCLPLSHVGGLSILIRSAIYGTGAVLHEQFEVDRVLSALHDPAGPTLVSLVPTTLTRLLDAGLRQPPSLRWALLGGAAISPALLERAEAAGVPVAATYGMTEACSQVATNGHPLFCTRVAIEPGGEVLVSGPTVAPACGPVLHTGDLGSCDERGRLRITGRKADTIITGAENVAPQEVEEALEAHPAIVEAAVHGRADPQWGEAVVATVVLDGTLAVSEAELRSWCAERLAAFKVPKRIEFSPSLPRTASGKLARRLLRDSTSPADDPAVD